HVTAGEGADQQRLGIRLVLIAAELQRRGAGQGLGAEQNLVSLHVLALAAAPGDAGAVDRGGHAQASATLGGTPSSSPASATVAARRPTSSAIWRALAIRSPLERHISPLGR